MGLAMNVHYCGDEIASVSLNTNFDSLQSEENCCGTIEKQSHCCSDKVVHFEKKSDQATAFTIHLDAIDALQVETWRPIVFVPFSINKNENSTEYSFQSNAPPLFKLYSQYIFYDRL